MRDTVLIVGAGPAGRAAAAACAEAGLPVTLVAPDPGRPWRNVYGAWVDELVPLGLDDTVAQRYPHPLVRTDRVAELPLPRVYGRLDNDGLQQRLRDRAVQGDVAEVAGAVRGATHDRDGSVVELADGRLLAAGVVVDASGHRPAVAVPGRGQEPAWQVAYGVIGRVQPAVVPEGRMCLMDWRGAGGTATPTFCYSLDLGGGLTLVEETALAARPAPGFEELRRALEARLRREGVAVVEEVALERVRFPMGGPLPPRDQRVVAFGAAAGMVHPATGFQVAAALRAAPALAAALARALARPAARPADVAAAGWQAVWPATRVRERALHAFGLEVLLRLDGEEIQRFFEGFFALPESQWRAYVSGAPSALATARTMLRVAARVPARVRSQLARTALGRDGARLVREVVAAGR